MPNYEEIIQQSQANVKALNEKLKELDKLHDDIKLLIQQPEIFETKYQQIVKLSEDYTNTLGASVNKYLDGNNTLFTEKLKELTTRITELQQEISRLANTDFNKLFRDLQKVFIEQTKKDLAEELKKFDNKSQDFQQKIDELKQQIERLVNTDFYKLFQDLQKVFIGQTRKDLEEELKKFDSKSQDFQRKIDELKQQIERLERIDLDKHFDKLQKTLSEIFGAINGINLILTSLTQTLAGAIQSLSAIQSSIENNHREVKQIIGSFSDTTLKHLSNQDNDAKRNVELLESKIISLEGQNDLMKKEIKTNRIILIVGLITTITVLIYIAVKL